MSPSTSVSILYRLVLGSGRSVRQEKDLLQLNKLLLSDKGYTPRSGFLYERPELKEPGKCLSTCVVRH